MKKISIPWLSPQTGCMFLTVLFCSVFVTLIIGLADLSESTQRGSSIARTLQSIQFRGIPVGAIVAGAFLLYEATKYGWRWADRIAIQVNDHRVNFHKSIRLNPIVLDEIESVEVFHRQRRWVKESNPSLRIRYRRQDGAETKEKTLSGIDLKCAEAQNFIGLLRRHGKCQ